jgi:hypothetical protein
MPADYGNLLFARAARANPDNKLSGPPGKVCTLLRLL